MALPTTIVSSNARLHQTSGWHGPFISAAGNAYHFVNKFVTVWNGITPYKATDVTSSFSAQSAWNVAADAESYWCTQVGDVIHVVVQEGSVTDGDVRYNSFNMTNDTWSVGNPGTVVKAHIAGDDIANYAASIAVRSDGDILTFFQGTRESIMGVDRQRIGFAFNEGTNFSDVTGQLTPDADYGEEHMLQPVAVMGASDKCHVFFRNDTLLDLIHVSINSVNTQSSAENVDTSTDGLDYVVGNAIYFDDSGTERIGITYRDASALASIGRVEDDGTPTSVTSVSGTQVEAVGARAIHSVAVAVDGTMHLVYADLTSNDLFRDEAASPWSTWGTDTEHLDAATIINVSVNTFTRAGTERLAIVYDNNGTITYDEFDLSAGPTLQSIAGVLTSLVGSQSTVKIFGQVIVGAIAGGAGAMVKSARKALSGTPGTIVGAIAKRAGKVLTGVANVLTGAVATVKLVPQAIAGVLSGALTGTLTNQALKPLAGALTGGVGILTRSTLKAATGVLTALAGSTSTVRIFGQAIAGVLTGALTGALLKKGQKAVAGAISNPAGVLTTLKTFGASIAGVLTGLSGSLATASTFVSNLAGSLAGGVGVLTRETQRALVGSLTVLTGVLEAVRLFATALTGVLSGSFTSVLTRESLKVLAGSTASLVGTVAKLTVRAISGVLTSLAGSVVTLFVKTLAGILAGGTGEISKKTLTVISGTITTLVGILGAIKSGAGAFTKDIAGSLTSFTGTLSRVTLKGLAGALTSLASVLVRAALFVTSLTGTLVTMSGTLSKFTASSLVGVLVVLSGTVATVRALSISLLGVLAGGTSSLARLTSISPTGILTGLAGLAGKLILQSVSGALTVLTGIGERSAAARVIMGGGTAAVSTLLAGASQIKKLAGGLSSVSRLLGGTGSNDKKIGGGKSDDR